MTQYLNTGNEVFVNVDDILCFCPASALPKARMEKATDMSGGTKRAAILTRSGQTLLVDVRFKTLKERLEKAVAK